MTSMFEQNVRESGRPAPTKNTNDSYPVLNGPPIVSKKAVALCFGAKKASRIIRDLKFGK